MRTEQWQDEVRQWVRGVVSAPTVALEHVRTEAWSTVWRTTGQRQRCWFKENTPPLTDEGPVQDVLADLAPEQASAPLAWDSTRGWLLTADGGPTLRDHVPEQRGMETSAVKSMLRDYAVLQQATLDHRDRLLAAGLPDRSPATAGETLRQVCAVMAAAPVGDPRHLTEEELATLEAARPGLEQAARVLTDGPVPMSFDHNDLFPRNVFLPRAGGGFRFFDFGESLWTHPFESLVMLEWELLHQHSIDVGDAGVIDLSHPPIRDVLDTYLHEWSDFADLPTLREIAAAALQIAPLYRAERWLEVLAHTPAALDQHGGTPRAWIFDVARPVRL